MENVSGISGTENCEQNSLEASSLHLSILLADAFCKSEKSILYITHVTMIHKNIINNNKHNILFFFKNNFIVITFIFQSLKTKIDKVEICLNQTTLLTNTTIVH